MAVQDFSKALRDRVAKSVRNKISRQSQPLKGFIGSSSDKVANLKSKLQAQSYNIILTPEGFNKLVEAVGDIGTFDEYKQYLVYRRNNRRKPRDLDDLIDDTSLDNTIQVDTGTIIKNTPYENLFKWTKEYLVLKGITDTSIITGNFEQGHTLGFLSFRSLVSFGGDIDLETTRVKIRENPSEAYFDRLNQLLLDLDLATTNSIKNNPNLYIGALKDFKTKAQLFIELQVKTNEAGTGNQDTSAILSTLGRKLSVFAKALEGKRSGNSEFAKLVKEINTSIIPVAVQLFDNLPQNIQIEAARNVESLLDVKGSRTYKQYVTDAVMSSILGIKNPTEVQKYKQQNLGKVLPDKAKLDKAISNLVKEVKLASIKTRKVVKARKDAERKIAQLRTIQGRFSSPLTLQNLINASLAQKIKENMGSPALNYRTGRFANSAQVTRISMGRTGLLTAFYTYMKYPYQTFEPGYLQGSIKRDPRLLIGTSIRQLARKIVSNNLRIIRE